MAKPNPTNWKIVIKGAESDSIWQTIWEVASALSQMEDWSMFSGNLAEGASGAALFFGYLAHATGDPKAHQTCRRLQDAAGQLLESQPMGSGLFGGFPGVGWAASHLRDLSDPDSPDPSSEIDRVICQMLDRPDWPGSYDLVQGLVGHGVYALERIDTGEGRAILGRVVNHLARLSVPTAEGFAWFTPPSELPSWQRISAPRGHWNLGMAHGIPGVLALLGRCFAIGIEGAMVMRMLEGGMAWIFANANPKGCKSWFDPSIPEGEAWTPLGSRVSWCYGDLGIAVSLLMASRDSRRKDWETKALQIARDAAARPRETRGIRDSGLCHGTAGNALLFLRLYHATGEACFLRAACDHLDWTLSFRDPGRPCGGFPKFEIDGQGQPRMGFVPGLLEGNAGVALALLAFVTNQAPNWDRHLLVSLEPEVLPEQ